MLTIFRWIFRNLATILLSFALALTVWISAVSASDPVEERNYGRSVAIDIIGQDPELLLTSDVPDQISLRLSAPSSIWNRLNSDQVQVRAVADLSGMAAGTHEVPVQVQVGVRPVEIVSYSPQTIEVVLEQLASRQFQVLVQVQGELAVGFQSETPVINEQVATVSGPETLVDQVDEVWAIVDTNNLNESIDRSIRLTAVDANDNVINGVTISPENVQVGLNVTQRGGYRNVVVKVTVSGQVESGYRVTNISVFPPAITVFSNDPTLVEQLPGYVQTEALNISGIKDDIDRSVRLDLPPGVSAVEGAEVEVQVGIAAIEGSLTLEGMPVEVDGLENGLAAVVSPEEVDIILSGPLPLLDQLRAQDIRVFVDMSGESLGTYQRVPQVEINVEDLQVESILPASIEVILQRQSGRRSTATPTVTPTIDIQLTAISPTVED